jgi:hypothetical protein
MPAHPRHPFAAGNAPGSRLSLTNVVFVACGAFLLSACSTQARFEPYKVSDAVFRDGDGVVILARRHHATHEAEQEFVDCISDSLASRPLDIHVMGATEFADMLYPYFEPSMAPRDVAAMAELFDRPGFSDRVAESGVRFIVWVDGSTDRVSSGGSMTCAAGIGGVGCMGLVYWEDSARYDVAVWDIETAREWGAIYADVLGRSFMPAVVIPVPLIARPRAAACRGLTERLEVLLTTPGGMGPGPKG